MNAALINSFSALEILFFLRNHFPAAYGFNNFVYDFIHLAAIQAKTFSNTFLQD
jgi:hypothetical protein